VKEEHITFRRDLFEIENARNLTKDELVRTFVPTRNFWRLMSAQNHIVLGSRGSGKTAIAKMLSHDHLSFMNEERARSAIRSKSFIGIYVPTKVEWVGALKNKTWQSEREKEEFFQWFLNISTCLSFLVTVKSCLNTYVRDKVERALAEEEISQQLSASWSGNTFKSTTIKKLQNYLEDILHLKHDQLARLRVLGRLKPDEEPAGLSFEASLFVPLRRGISLVSRLLEFPEESTWLLCLDEAEFLEPLHHRILNTCLRASSGNLVFKITTMPYFHHTLDTNTGVPLNEGHDFEYVYIDQDPVISNFEREGGGTRFALELFSKRAGASQLKYQRVSLNRLLGGSRLLEPKESSWAIDSPEMSLLERHASKETYQRAIRLLNDKKKFGDELSRKLHGALLLREAVASLKGHKELDVYSGDLMVIRCQEGNPRRLIRIFNSLLLRSKWVGGEPQRLKPKEQTRILRSFSASVLTRVQSEPEYGPELYQFLLMVGVFMNHKLHNEPLRTDQISSIEIVRTDSDRHWALVKTAVGLGLLYPNVSPSNPDQMPDREGEFHLAYVLAPYFKLLPRRGKSVRLSTILQATMKKTRRDLQQYLFSDIERSDKENEAI
jgi:hypothetical protein